MYAPKFTYTDKLVSTLIKIEHNKTVLQNTDLSYNSRYKLNVDNKAQDIFHLGHMLGLTLTMKDADKIANGLRIDGFESDQNQIIINYKKNYEYLRGDETEAFSELERSIMLNINKIMLNQWRENWEANFRNFNDRIDDRWDSYLKLRDESITGPQVEKNIDELIEWYKYSVPVVPTIVRIAIAFYRLIEIAPFTAGNKFTILAILDHMFLKSGLSSRTYFSTFQCLNSFEERLQKNISAVKMTMDLSIWIEAFATNLYNCLVDSRQNLSKYIAEEEKSKQQPFLDLNKRQLKILKYLQTVPNIKREDYCQVMEVSTMTAFRDLNELVRKKLLRVEGQGRGTRYRLVSS